jgi:hypothetical protein
MIQNAPDALTISSVKPFKLTSTSLHEAVRIQSLNEMDFITTNTAKHPLHERVREDAQAKRLELNVTLEALKASVPVQQKALEHLSILYATLEAGQTPEAQHTWQAWLGYMEATLQDAHTVYTQEFAVQALPDSSDVRQYFPAYYTTQALPNQEQLRQMIGYWHEQEGVLATLINKHQQALNVLYVTLENLQALNPKTNPHHLLC